MIHTDFERGFIKAEVVAFDDFKVRGAEGHICPVAATLATPACNICNITTHGFQALATGKSMSEVKAAGKYRQEGKTYVMMDGDIVHFQFNVTAPAKKK